MELLKGKVGIVTGAASGIGRATAITAAREGSKVTVSDINTEYGEKTVDTIREQGGDAIFVKVDVSKADDVQKMIEKTVETFGGLHWASNNAAGGEAFGPLENVSDETWNNTIDITLKGVFYCIKYEFPEMVKCGGGSIINISSLAGINGNAFLGAYSAAKGGVEALTKTAACEFAARGIRVNSICPGGVQTRALELYFKNFPDVRDKMVNKHPLGRFCTPEEIADAVIYLASERSSFITGHSLVVDGGLSVKTNL